MSGSSVSPPASAVDSQVEPQRPSEADGPPSLPSYDSMHPAKGECWRVHDRTHLELLVDYPLSNGEKVRKYVWEAYFFLPRSLKLDSGSYTNDEIYRDFQSYVRFAAEEPSVEELCHLPNSWTSQTLQDRATAMRALRVYGAQFRVAALRGRERLLRGIANTIDPYLNARLSAFADGMKRALVAFRAASRRARVPAVVAVVRYVDEDMSRVVEEVFSTLCARLREAGAEALAVAAERVALDEAQYRADNDREPPLASGRSLADEAEFRRHALKRFSSSVLWISRDISRAGGWTREVLFAVAASVAMVFAVLAAFYYGTEGPTQSGSLWVWVLLVVAAYAMKDRIKAYLQGMFSGWISRRFADRRWKLTYLDESRRIGIVEERSRFVPEESLPKAVQGARELEREHDVEEVAHPERVLSHRKDVTLRCREIAELGRPFGAVTEVFRLDISRWLVHTDDPKQRVHYADLERQQVVTAMARRIYHVDIVYRIRTLQDVNAHWQGCRVVMNRNGIRRIETHPRT